MIRLIAENLDQNLLVVRSNEQYVFIDTTKKDVVKVEDSCSLKTVDGWTRPASRMPSNGIAELATAATTSLSVAETTGNPEKSFRVPKSVQETSLVFNSETVPLEKIHNYSKSSLFSSQDASESDAVLWVTKVLESHPASTPLVAAGFVFDDAVDYFGRGVDSDSTEITALLMKRPDDSWAEWENGDWKAIDPPLGTDIIMMLDQESVKSLVDHLDSGDSTPLVLSMLHPEEFGLFYSAESELDFELLDRTFDIYDSQERSVNAQKQVRGPGGKFVPKAGGEDATPAAPKARLTESLPLVENISSRIDEYKAEVLDKRKKGSLSSSNMSMFADDSTPATDTATPVTDVRPLYLAIVDAIDTDAVLDVVALVPAPASDPDGDVSAWKRDKGTWIPAPNILSNLRGSTPPPVIELKDDTVLKGVLDQVDKSTTEDATPPAETPGETETDASGEAVPTEEEKPVAQPVTAAMNGDWTQKSRDKAAKKGKAMKDGSYPIIDKEDLKRAVQSYGRAKNKSETKKHIIKRARSLKATDLLPEDWNFSAVIENLVARGYAFSDGSLIIENVPELRQAVKEAFTVDQKLHVIKRARAMNRFDLIPSHWNARETTYTEQAATLWGPFGEILPLSAGGGLDRNRGGAERLRRYWTKGPGAAKIMWPVDGAWRRCVANLSKYLGPRAKGYCNLRFHEMRGYYPGDKRNR